MRKYHQKLPTAGPEREALRQKGQFWTPDWIAEAMVGYVTEGESNIIFDPAVGAGAFFLAAKVIASETHRIFELRGTEIDSTALQQARLNGLLESDLLHVEISDFVLKPPSGTFKAIVANPPYIRHHRLSTDVKLKLKDFCVRLIGTPLDGRAGLHVYFLLRALQLLAMDGRLAFIMPADTCEGIFATTLWKWITANYCLDAVATFAHEASPFPGVDTNPIIFFIRNDTPKKYFSWARCLEPNTTQLKTWTLSGFKEAGDALVAKQRLLSEGVRTGLSRAPVEEEHTGLILGDLVKVMRGIATGANEFFFLTTKQAKDLELPDEFLLPAIGRTRDVSGDEINHETLKVLEESNKPTLLFSPSGQPANDFPKPVQKYLKHGETLGVHKKTLIATRNPWYKMEVRPVPPFLFAYLGRRNARFIRNTAGVLPLTGFLCVYPQDNDPAFIKRLWLILKHPDTVANLSLVGKSYGFGAVKVEPRGLEKLPIPSHVALENQFLLRDRAAKKQATQGALFG